MENKIWGLLTKELIRNVISPSVCLHVSHICWRSTSELMLPNHSKLPDYLFNTHKEFVCVNWRFSQVAKSFSRYYVQCCSPSWHQLGCLILVLCMGYWVILFPSASPVQTSAPSQREGRCMNYAENVNKKDLSKNISLNASINIKSKCLGLQAA